MWASTTAGRCVSSIKRVKTWASATLSAPPETPTTTGRPTRSCSRRNDRVVGRRGILMPLHRSAAQLAKRGADVGRAHEGFADQNRIHACGGQSLHVVVRAD